VTTTLYVAGNDYLTGCESETRTPVQVLLQPLPGEPYAADVVLCGSGGAITFTGSMGTPAGQELRLYSTQSAASPLATDANSPYHLTTTISATTAMVLSSYDPITGCSSKRVPVVGYLENPPASPIVFDIIRCGPGTVTISASMGNPAGSIMQLYSQPIGGPVLASSTGPQFNFILPNISVDAVYYVQASRVVQGDTCYSARVPVNIKVLSIPEPPVAQNVIRCGSGSVTITADMGLVPGDVIRLYTNSIGGNIISTDGVAPYHLLTPTILANTDFYLASFSSLTGCESKRTPVTVTLEAIPGVPTVADIARCGEGTATFTAFMNSPPGNKVLMYTLPSGGEDIFSATNPAGYTLNTPFLTTSALYYFEVRSSSNCASARASATVTIHSNPKVPNVSPIEMCGANVGTFTVTGVPLFTSEISLYSSPPSGARRHG